MSEEPKVWPVMLIVAVMVLSVAAVMFIGAENELPAPQLPDNYQLRYSASVEYQDRTVNGTQTANYTGTSFSIYPEWEEENYTGPAFWEGYNGGWMIEELAENTTWGTKYVRVCIGLGLGDVPSFHIEFRSSDSSIVYKKVVVTPEYRATFILTSVNFTEILDLDLGPSGEEPFPGYPDYDPDHPDHWDLQGGANDAMAKVTPGHDWYRLNVSNYAYYYFGQEDVRSMIDGGGYRYDQERSIVGNGTLRFQATGEWYVRYIWPLGDGPNVFTMDGALTEEE